MVDDAYITLRHAENLLHGKGLVYNEGARVLGATGPIYPFWIALILLLSFGLEVGYAIGAANVVAFALTAWGLWGICSGLSRKCAVFVLIVFAIYLGFVDNSTTGVETPLFLLAMIASMYLLKRDRLGWLSVAVALSMLIRPEGILWAVSILLVLVLMGKRLRTKHFVPGVLVLLVWVALSIGYYGSPIPHSVKAKSGWFIESGPVEFSSVLGRPFLALSLLEPPRQLMRFAWVRAGLIAACVVTVVSFIYGARRFFQRKSVLSALPALFVLYLVFYLAGKCTAFFSWYGVPSGLAYLTTVIFGIGYLSRHLRNRWASDILVRAGGVVLAICLLLTTVVVWKEIRLPYYRLIRASYEAAGEFVDEIAGPEDSIFTAEIGMIGYRAKRYVYGMGGLVSPEILDLYQRESPDIPTSEILKAFRPEFLVLDAHHLRRLRTQGDVAWVAANYESLATFPGHQVLGRIGGVRRALDLQ
jgi:hypothetical protein